MTDNILDFAFRLKSRVLQRRNSSSSTAEKNARRQSLEQTQQYTVCLTSEEIPKERVFERGDRRINEEKRKKRKKRNRKKTRWRNVGGETNCRRRDVSRREIEQESIDRVCFSLYIALALLHDTGRKKRSTVERPDSSILRVQSRFDA